MREDVFGTLTLLFAAALGIARVDLPSRERPSVREVTSGAEWGLFNKIVTRLENQTRFDFPRDVRKILIDHSEMNAWAIPDQRLIIVTTAMMRFLSHSEGELACIIGHEMGHVIDRECAGPRRGPASGKELLGAILGGGKGAAAAASRACEGRADEIGLQFMVGAGYNPYDCAASFGRQIMLREDTGLSGFLTKWVYSTTHPLNNERIADFRRTLLRHCQRFPDDCR